MERVEHGPADLQAVLDWARDEHGEDAYYLYKSATANGFVIAQLEDVMGICGQEIANLFVTDEADIKSRLSRWHADAEIIRSGSERSFEQRVRMGKQAIAWFWERKGGEDEIGGA